MRIRVVTLVILVAAFGAAVAGAENDPDQAQTSGQLQQLHHPAMPMQAPLTSGSERAALHSGPDWDLIAPHLPDPATASAVQLETAGDVLRARRFPEDALDYYGYSLARGGNVSELMNKMGILRMELGQIDLAREMFLRVVHVEKKNANAWNNLGVAEYLRNDYSTAAKDYKKASGLNKQSAAFHSNLGMAYFQMQDMTNAQRQFGIAVQLNPAIMDPADGSGTMVQIVGNRDYAGLCFQMASMFAHWNKPEQMERWLAKASEAGYDVKAGMAADPAMKPYLQAPEVKLILANSETMRKSVAKLVRPPDSNPNR